MIDFPTGRTQLSSDTNTIREARNESWSFEVGQHGVTAIIAYDESGDMAYVPWIAVLKGDAVAYRANASQFVIQYEGDKF